MSDEEKVYLVNEEYFNGWGDYIPEPVPKGAKMLTRGQVETAYRMAAGDMQARDYSRLIKAMDELFNPAGKTDAKP